MRRKTSRAGSTSPDLEEIARTFGQRKHPADQTQRRDDAKPEHPAPRAGVGERVIDDVGGENADGDRKLIERDQRAAHVGRRDFRDVERRNDRTESDRNADDEAPASSTSIVGAKAETSAPTAKMTRRQASVDAPADRDRRSIPATADPTMQPISTTLIVSSCSLRVEREVVRR